MQINIISKKLNIWVVVFILINFLWNTNSFAQCAMCRASLESTGDVQQAEAVNDGIVYLMIIPYALVALVAFTIYKMYYKKKAKNNTI